MHLSQRHLSWCPLSKEAIWKLLLTQFSGHDILWIKFLVDQIFLSQFVLPKISFALTNFCHKIFEPITFWTQHFLTRFFATKFHQTSSKFFGLKICWMHDFSTQDYFWLNFSFTTKCFFYQNSYPFLSLNSNKNMSRTKRLK